MTRRAYVTVIAIALAAAGVVAAVVILWVYSLINRPLPYEFTQDVYIPTPAEVCPGEAFTWERGVIANDASTPILASALTNPNTNLSIEPSRLGEAGVNVWVSYSDVVGAYYEQINHPIVEKGYPIVITRQITATIPTTAPYGEPVVLTVSTVVGPQARYHVPVWVKSEAECKGD